MIKDATTFGRTVVPLSIVVVKEIYNWTDMLKICDNPKDFLNMGGALQAQVKILKEALRTVIELHVQVHN